MENQPEASDDERRRQEIREIGQAVKMVRNSRGWSLRRLAGEAGLSASLLSAVETGKIVPTVGSLFAISDALGARTETFFPLRRRPIGAESQTSAEDGQGVSPDELDTNSITEREPSAGGQQAPIPAISVSPRSSPDDSEPLTVPAGAVEATDADSLSSRRAIRRPRVIHRRSNRFPSADAEREALTTKPSRESKSVTESIVDRSAGGPNAPATLPGTPGISVRRAGERPKMVLEDGTIWSLPLEILSEIGQVIEVSVSAGSVPLARHRVRDRAFTVMVTQGRLRIEAAFVGTVLEAGDSAVVSAGVPHRLVGLAESPTTFLVFICGEWDGKL